VHFVPAQLSDVLEHIELAQQAWLFPPQPHVGREPAASVPEQVSPVLHVVAPQQT
jgi:hypothetical protein